ncbi:hypothetical protein DL93DRAFT_2197105, partial [Clavulina sp. PMI_390]
VGTDVSSSSQHSSSTHWGINEPAASSQFSSKRWAEHGDRASQSVILRLPFEILSDISLLAMLPLDFSIWKAPWLAVNSWWRACVIDTPRIWSCVEVRGGPHAKERLERWIGRSGTGPLHITVWNTEVFQALEKLWARGDPNPGGRIHQLTIHHNDRSQPIPFPISFETPKLRRLNAMFSYVRRWQDGHSFVLLSPNSTPQLETLRVHNKYFSPGAIKATGLSVSSLKSLTVQEELTAEDILDILKRAPNLEHLKWDISQPDDLEEEDFPRETPRLVLQSMQHLELSLGYAQPNFFRVTQVPNLQRLSLKGNWEPEEISSLLASVSECREITHLRILSDGDHEPSEDDVALLCRALRKLRYIDPGWRDGNMDALLALSDPTQTAASSLRTLQGEAGRR